jgi:hypothetical protein
MKEAMPPAMTSMSKLPMNKRCRSLDGGLLSR